MTSDADHRNVFSTGEGTAGCSARRRGTRLRLPAIGAPAPLGELLGPILPPPPVAAIRWEQGAAGEELTGRLLEPLTHLGWVVLHDRRIPGSAANLDHLLIGPGAVWVVDTKAWRGRVKLLGDGRLWYGRTPLDQVLAAVRWQAEVVKVHLERRLGQAVTTAPVLCLHGARLPGDPLNFGCVTIVSGARLLALVSAGEPVSGSADEAQRLAATTAGLFPPR